MCLSLNIVDDPLEDENGADEDAAGQDQERVGSRLVERHSPKKEDKSEENCRCTAHYIAVCEPVLPESVPRLVTRIIKDYRPAAARRNARPARGRPIPFRRVIRVRVLAA